MTTPQDPQNPLSPQDPSGAQFPQYPPGSLPPAPTPRRLRARRVWAGIGIGIGANCILGGLLSVGVYTATGGTNAGTTIGSAVSLLVFLAVIVVGIVLMVRGDRSLGLGLLIGGGGIPIVLAGVCVAIIIAIGASGGSG